MAASALSVLPMLGKLFTDRCCTANVRLDGRPFTNIDEYKTLLLSDKDQLARALAGKLLSYATGAAPTIADQANIEKLIRNVRDKDYGFRSLVHEIVQSEAFQTK